MITIVTIYCNPAAALVVTLVAGALVISGAEELESISGNAAAFGRSAPPHDQLRRGRHGRGLSLSSLQGS